MAKDCGTLMPKIIELLKENLGQTIKELAKQLKVNRSFLAGYLSKTD